MCKVTLALLRAEAFLVPVVALSARCVARPQGLLLRKPFIALVLLLPVLFLLLALPLSLAAARLSATAAHIAQLAATAAAAPLDAFYAALSDDIAAFEAHCSQERLRHETAHVAAIAKVRSAVNLLWPRAQVRPFGSYATGLMRPGSDIDLVVSLPQVRTTKAMPDAPGALEGRNAIPKDTWHASLARCLLHQAWVIADTVRVVPAKVPIVSFATRYTVGGGAPLRLDVSFESALHLGLYTNDFVHAALREHPPLRPLLLVLKHFLARRSLDKPYLGGLSAYGLLLLVLRFPARRNCCLIVVVPEYFDKGRVASVELVALLGKLLPRRC